LTRRVFLVYHIRWCASDARRKVFDIKGRKIMNIRSVLGLFFAVSVLTAPSAHAAQAPRTFSVEFSQYDLRAEQHYLADETYDLFKIGDFALTTVAGNPCLPVKTLNIYVPEGNMVGYIRVEAISTRELPGEYLLLPAQQEIPLAEGFTAEPVLPDKAIYSLAEPYPVSPARLAGDGSIGGRRIASVEVYPLQYVPAERRLILNERIRLTVEFEDADHRPEIPRETEAVRRLRNGIVRRMVENPEDVEMDFPGNPATLDPAAATEYLIICLDAHADEYEVLKNWKTRKGIPAAIVTIEDINATYPGRDAMEQIRNCIMDYYLNESTVWVTLTLSAPKARVRGCYCSVGGTVDAAIPCDLYFADMDGDWNLDNDSYWGETNDDVDLYSDVFVGRLPANRAAKCSTVVHKILTYEGYYALPSDYQREMLFLAEYADDITDGAIAKNMIDSESVPPRFDPITKLYQSSGNLNKTSAMNALNAGMGIINHDGHGNASTLSIGPSALYTDDMMALTNAPRYSVFYTVACTPGNFDNPFGFFGRGFLESPGGGGFFIGNSRYGWYWPGSPGYGTGEVYDREFFKAMFVRGNDHLGTAHADAKAARAPYSGSNGTDRWTQFTSNLFGDPETPIWLDTPIAVSATHPGSIEAGNHMITVSVSAGGSPLGQARVCLWMDPSIYEIAETDGGGNADFSISPADSGAILVTVTKNGHLPYLGTIDVEDGLSGVTGADEPPSRLAVRIAPNPVTGSAVIRYALPALPAAGGKGPVARIYDASGRLVRSLTPAAAEARDNAMVWDGRLASGSAAPPGIYFLRLAYGDQTTDTKFVILK
jgi:hypothetical protein